MEKKKLLLVSLGHLSCDLNGGALPASLPYIRSACGLDYQATGGLMLAYSCLSSMIQPLFGLLADRHNKPWFIPVGILMGGFGLAFVGFLTNYWAIFAGIAICGVGSAFFHPEGARFANKFAGHSKGAGLSIFSIGGNSGYMLGPIIIAAVVGPLGLHGMAVFALIALLAAGILFFKISAMAPLPRETDNAALEKAAASAADPNTAAGDELAETSAEPAGANDWRQFSLLIFIVVSRSIIFAGCNTFIPLYWVSQFGQPAAAGAIALVVFGAFGVGFNMLGGIVSDRIGYVPVIRIAFLCMAPVMCLFGQIDNIILAWCVLPLIGFVLYAPFSAQVVLGQKLLGRNLGFASGVTLGLSTTLGGMAQPCMGWLADGYGLHAVFLCLAVFGLVGCIFSFLLSSRTGLENA